MKSVKDFRRQAVLISAAIMYGGIAIELAACSGGGGGVDMPTASPSQIATVTPPPTNGPTFIPAPVHTTGPTATPTATPVPNTASGTIQNFDSKAALSGATIYISHTLVPGATAPGSAPSDGGETTTSSSGAYSIKLPAIASYPAHFYIEVFAPNMVTAHEIMTVSKAGATTVPTIGLTTLSPNESAWINLMNSDRAKWNAAPVVADETSEETARLWVLWMGMGHYEHACASGDVNCPNKTAYASSENADFSSTGENIGFGEPDYNTLEANFMAEASNCPQPTDPQTCPYQENTGHFLNIVNQTVIWVGTAEDLNAASPQSGANPTYFDQEFAYPNLDGASVNIKSFSIVVGF